MKKTIESVVLENHKGEELRIYKPEGFREGEDIQFQIQIGEEAFSFRHEEVDEIKEALDSIIHYSNPKGDS